MSIWKGHVLYIYNTLILPHRGLLWPTWGLSIPMTPHNTCPTWWVRNTFEIPRRHRHWGSSYLLDLLVAVPTHAEKCSAHEYCAWNGTLYASHLGFLTEGRWNRFCDRTPVFLELGRQEQGLVKTTQAILVRHLSFLWGTPARGRTTSGAGGSSLGLCCKCASIGSKNTITEAALLGGLAGHGFELPHSHEKDGQSANLKSHKTINRCCCYTLQTLNVKNKYFFVLLKH